MAVGQDISGNNVYDKMDGFMSSRESLAGQPNVLAFMDAQSKTQYIPFSPGPVLSQENMLLMKSGYVNASLHSRSADDGETSRGDSEEAEREKNARMTRAMVNSVIAQTMTYDGMTFTYEEVNSNLTNAIAEQKKFLERELPEVKKDNLLYVDSNGRIVPAGTPGARQVMTLEEKTEIENKTGVCTMQKAGEEITVINGKMVPTDSAMVNMAVQDKIATTEEILKKIESGKMKLEEIPENVKADIKEMKEHGTLAAVKADTGPGVLGQLEQQDAQSRIVDDYQQRMGTPAPALVHNLSPAPPTI